MTEQRPVRPAEHMVHGMTGPVVVIDGRVCALLTRIAGLDELRTDIRGQDPQLDQALVAIKLAGVAYTTTESSPTGTISAPHAEPVSPSRQQETSDTVGTTTAASILGLTPRAVRKAITEKRLTATLLDGRYRITRHALAQYLHRP